MIARFTVIATCVGVVGCATDINLVNARRYYETGLQAERVKNWTSALEAYRRSLTNAQSAEAPHAFVSAVTYNLGRMAGYTCDSLEAERLLLESLALEQGLPSPDPGNITKRWSELARLYQSQQRFGESATFFGLAVPELERLGVVESDPVGFARYLDDYALSLSRSGREGLGASVRARASELRSKYASREAQFIPVYYSDLCSK